MRQSRLQSAQALSPCRSFRVRVEVCEEQGLDSSRLTSTLVLFGCDANPTFPTTALLEIRQLEALRHRERSATDAMTSPAPASVVRGASRGTRTRTCCARKAGTSRLKQSRSTSSRRRPTRCWRGARLAPISDAGPAFVLARVCRRRLYRDSCYPDAAVRDATAHWFEVFIATGIDFLGSCERDARVSDEFRAVLVQEVGDGVRRPAGDLLEGVGRVVVLAGEDRPLARDE
jgi:hypothetical protein